MTLNDILTHIVKEIQQLEKYGICVNGKLIKGTVVCLTHDNLAAHMLFCMVLGFNARFFCRFCKVTLSDSLAETSENQDLIRTNIKQDIAHGMDENGRIHDHHKTFGFRGYSELLKLEHFNLETGSTVDPFHDLLEGIVQRDLKHVFHHMIRKMKVSESRIIERLHAFKFGIINNCHKPANIKLNKESLKLGLSGMEALTLLLNFDYIYGDLFQNDVEILSFVKNLKHGVVLSFRNSISESEIETLNECIQLHLSKLELFENATRSRKHHFWVHYPTIIRRLGPPGLMSTAALENKHVFFTRHVRKTSINKNVVKTLANRHQFVMAQKLLKGCQHELFLGKIKKANPEMKIIWKRKLNLQSSEVIEEVTWVKRGYKYAPSYVFYRKGHLLEIEHIVKIRDHLFLKCKEYNVEEETPGCCYKMINTKGDVFLNFEKVAFIKTYNKVIGTDGSMHVVII